MPKVGTLADVAVKLLNTRDEIKIPYEKPYDQHNIKLH